MATKEQYDFFVRLYDIEESRTNALMDRAKWYLSLSAIYTAVIGVIVEHMKPANACQYVVFAVSTVSMVAAFALSIWAVRIATFERVEDPETALTKLIATDFDQTKFFVDGMVGHVVAAERNAKTNNKQVGALELAGYAMAFGIILDGLYFVLFLWP